MKTSLTLYREIDNLQFKTGSLLFQLYYKKHLLPNKQDKYSPVS